MSDYDPILSALSNDLLGIVLLFMIFGMLHFIPSMVVAYVAGMRTERMLSELPRGTFWGWVMGVPIWVAVMVLQIFLAEMLLGKRLERFRVELYFGFAVTGFIAAVSLQYHLVVHYFRSKTPEQPGWQYDGPIFQTSPQRYFTFSLRKLLIAQVVLIFLFGLWVGARREGILEEYESRRLRAPIESLRRRLGIAHGWDISANSTGGIGLHQDDYRGPLRNFNDDVLAQIRPARLLSIDLHSDQLTDKGLEILIENEELRNISIRSINVSDAGIFHLRQLKGLRFLSLDCPQLTERVLDELQAMPALEEITLHRTDISAERVEEFNQQNPGKHLKVAESRRESGQ